MLENNSLPHIASHCGKEKERARIIIVIKFELKAYILLLSLLPIASNLLEVLPLVIDAIILEFRSSLRCAFTLIARRTNVQCAYIRRANLSLEEEEKEENKCVLFATALAAAQTYRPTANGMGKAFKTNNHEPNVFFIFFWFNEKQM